MTKVVTLLKGLIRRVKRMGEFWLTTGVLFIPFGFWLMAEYPDARWMGAIAGGIGIFCWFMAFWMIRARERREREEKLQLLSLDGFGTLEPHRRLDAIIEELKALNKALGKDKEGTE